jgi:hypothetical protein
MDEDLKLGIWRLVRQDMCGFVSATALCRELARLYAAAGEPVPAVLRAYAPQPEDTEDA